MSNHLPILAESIRNEHEHARASFAASVEHAIRAGRSLIEAKALVPHGDWQEWLSTNVPGMSVRTAQRFMRAARNSKNDKVSFSSIKALVCPQVRIPRPNEQFCTIGTIRSSADDQTVMLTASSAHKRHVSYWLFDERVGQECFSRRPAHWSAIRSVLAALGFDPEHGRIGRSLSNRP